jgi:hypothetical protein
MAVNFAKLSEMLQSALRDGFGSGTVQRIKREMDAVIHWMRLTPAP